MIYSEIIGRLGLDAEIKTSKNGNQFVTMRVASNDYVNGEETTTWVRVVWSGERAVKMQEHMKKGRLVSVRGSLRTSLYDNKNGEKAISIDLFADRVDFVSIGNGNQQNETPSETNAAPKANDVPPTPTTTQEEVDDLPF